jgi:histidinol-phosphate aminotransferase
MGYQVPQSEANFVWLGNGDPAEGGIDAQEFGKQCEANGVIVRVFPDSGVRVTIGTADENDAFLAAAGLVVA